MIVRMVKSETNWIVSAEKKERVLKIPFNKFRSSSRLMKFDLWFYTSGGTRK